VTPSVLPATTENETPASRQAQHQEEREEEEEEEEVVVETSTYSNG